MNTEKTPGEIIDDLGGTGKTAEIFGIEPSSVSQWRHNGIPKARMMYLKVAHPEVLKRSDNIQARSGN